MVKLKRGLKKINKYTLFSSCGIPEIKNRAWKLRNSDYWRYVRYLGWYEKQTQHLACTTQEFLAGILEFQRVLTVPNTFQRTSSCSAVLGNDRRSPPKKPQLIL